MMSPTELLLPPDSPASHRTSTQRLLQDSKSRIGYPDRNSGQDSNRNGAPEDSGYRQVLADATASIHRELALVERLLELSPQATDVKLQSMLDHVRTLGGKRLRPVLTLLCAKACGKITEETIRLAAAVELVHTATLVHDDILDSASRRRHSPTLHVAFDTPSSILAGDWLFTHAYGLANEGESTRPGRWIADAAKQVCEGEIRQGNTIGHFELTEPEYYSILAAKTGALCSVACRLGAWSAGADPASVEQFAHYGTQLGLAFQIFDDWLDVWGNPMLAGKTLGTDLASRKPTLPAIRTLEVSRNRDRWIQVLRTPSIQHLKELRREMENSDASNYTLRKARERSGFAVGALANGLPQSETIDFLGRLAVLSTDRGA